MRTVRQLLAAPLILLIVFSGSAIADQQHVVDPGQLGHAIAQQLASQDADRAAVREALDRADVQAMAASMGVDLVRVKAAVNTMSASEVAQAATAARQVNQQLVGGASTVVISTTTLIIALLVIILLIVALK